MSQEKVTPLVAKNSTPVAATPEKTAEKTAVTKAAESKPAKKKTAAKKKPAVKKAAAKKSAVKRKTTASKKRTVKAVKKAVDTSVSQVKKLQSVTNQGSAKLYTIGTQNKSMEKLMVQGKTQFDKLSNDATEMGRENVEAVIKSSTIFAKGMEDIMRMSMSIAQGAAERQGKFMKEVMGSKNLNDFAEVQNKIAQANFDDFMSGATKITEMSVKMLNECVEPINSQFTKGMNTAKKSMAA